MAGKTLPGIGEDESGEHEGADLSDSGLREADKPASARPTDRMPLALPTATLHGPPSQTLVDDDKVAEGLKKLRSLDEPLGSLATTTPTMKEGMPVVGATPPLMTPAVAAAELLRSRGTAHGHAITPGVVQAMLPVTVDDRMKGTLLGHSLHLPDLPAPSEENRPAEVHSVSSVITDLAHAPQVPPAGSLRRSEMHGGFSQGDSRFFEGDPAATDVYPFEKPARSNFMFRGVVFFAAVAVVGVAAFAWFNGKSSEETEARAPAPAVEGTVTPPAAGEIAPAASPSATTTPAPAGMAGAAPAAAAPAAAAPAAAPPAPAPPATAPADEAPAESPTAKLKRELAAAEAAKAPRATNKPTPTRTARRSDKPSVAPTPVTKPAPSPGKHGKVTDDPDGTLPLSD